MRAAWAATNALMISRFSEGSISGRLPFLRGGWDSLFLERQQIDGVQVDVQITGEYDHATHGFLSRKALVVRVVVDGDSRDTQASGDLGLG